MGAVLRRKPCKIADSVRDSPLGPAARRIRRRAAGQRRDPPTARRVVTLPRDEPARTYAMSSHLRGLLVYLRSRNAPVEPVLDVLGLSEDELRDPDQRIDEDLQDELFRVAEE